MHKKPRTILAIDPGLREIGYAVAAGKQLITSGVLSLRVEPRRKRLARFREALDAWTRAYRPCSVVLEHVPKRPLDSIAGLPALGRLVRRFAKRHRLTFATYSATTVRQSVVGDGWAAKHVGLVVMLETDGDHLAGGQIDVAGLAVCVLYSERQTVAECAADQGRFWEMHKALFAASEAWIEGDTEAEIAIVAADVGLDAAAFQSCLAGRAALERVLSDQSDATGIISQTPSFVVVQGERGLLIEGSRPADQFVATLQGYIDAVVEGS